MVVAVSPVYESLQLCISVNHMLLRSLEVTRGLVQVGALKKWRKVLKSAIIHIIRINYDLLLDMCLCLPKQLARDVLKVNMETCKNKWKQV